MSLKLTKAIAKETKFVWLNGLGNLPLVSTTPTSLPAAQRKAGLPISRLGWDRQTHGKGMCESGIPPELYRLKPNNLPTIFL